VRIATPAFTVITRLHGVMTVSVEHIAREHLTYPKCQSLISVTRSMKVRTFADNSRDVG
jgi:hypothetical protein